MAIFAAVLYTKDSTYFPNKKRTKKHTLVTNLNIAKRAIRTGHTMTTFFRPQKRTLPIKKLLKGARKRILKVGRYLRITIQFLKRTLPTPIRLERIERQVYLTTLRDEPERGMQKRR